MQQTVLCLEPGAIDRNIVKFDSIARLHFGSIGTRLVVIRQQDAVFLVIVDYKWILTIVFSLVPNLAAHSDLCIITQPLKAWVRETVGRLCGIIVVVVSIGNVLGQLDGLEDKGLSA